MKAVERKTVGVFFYPWAPELCMGNMRVTLAEDGFRGAYRKVQWHKANPRSEAYMRALFHEQYPEGEFLVADTDGRWLDAICRVDTIVLLYPDAIGQGFFALERRLFRAKSARVEVRVLNGRRRDFRLDLTVLWQLRARRVLENTLAGELLATGVFLLVSPLLVAWDLLRGRS
jgi:hypothetical protein